MLRALVAAASLFLLAACAPGPIPPASTMPRSPSTPLPSSAIDLDTVAVGQRAAGFVAQAVYVDDAGRARGARFVHERTRFVFDYLVIESAPQAFVYATTYPTSDGGAPHTQEHLLLGKGNKGRWLGNYDHVMLAEWSAFTAQFRTAYHFHTSAGVSAFWGILRAQLDALLHPDYSDEEIRREVRNFGVTKLPSGAYSLDEKGTVYNEMVRTYEAPATLAWDALGRLVYGDGHPLALSNGGTPEGIRALTPEEIRHFHGAHYQLANMGMIGAFPSAVTLATVLGEVDQTLSALAPERDTTPYVTEKDVPPARATEAEALKIVEYPYATADQPSPAILGWPATRHLDAAERTLLEVFLGAFAGGEGSTMYEALVDTKTRTLDLGATQVWPYVSDDPGQPVYLGAESVSATHNDEASLRALRDLVLARLRAIAALADGSPGLAAFGERVKARVIEARRGLAKALDTPPQFGTRGTGDFWIRLLNDLNREGGFRKELTMKAAYDRALALASSTANPWRARLAGWGLLEPPCGVMTRASPRRREQLDQEKESRIAAEITRLEGVYATHDPQEALRRRAAEIERATAAIAHAEASVPMPPFVSDPPMTLDDSLLYRETRVAGVPVVASTFETMKSATVGLALRVDSVAEADLPYLSLLPQLLRNVGVIQNGAPVPYDEMSDRLRREILGLGVGFDTSFTTGRAELSITGSGDDVEEARRALGWMRDVLTSPDWRKENLPRLRDVVNRRATELRDVMSGAEEYWVSATAEAYRRQDAGVLAHTASFLARAHDAFRLSWLLEGGDAKTATCIASLAAAGKKLDRASLTKLAQELGAIDQAPAPGTPHSAIDPWLAPARALAAASPSSRPRLARAGRELGQILADLPDASLGADWEYLCAAIAHDSQRDPNETLDAFRRVLSAIAHVANARVWVVGSTPAQAALAPDLARLLSALDAAPPPSPPHPARARVTARARARGAATSDPRLVALVNPSTANGAVVNSARTADYDATSEAALEDFLAGSVFSGSGTHSFYKRIWGAALAYSGYIAISPRRGRIELYSDRCADLPQLLRFVDGEVRSAPADPRFVEYAVANTFGARTGDTFEERAQAMATDLAEGLTADRVRAFRARLLALRSRPGLSAEIHARLLPVYAAVIPSLAATAPLPDGALWFVVGPESQLARYESELASARGASTALLRLYPRDFWDFSARPAGQ